MGMFLLAMLTFWGCKPTEKNYRDAYVIAQQKKEQQQELAGGKALQLDDHLSLRPIDGDSLWVSHEGLRGKSLDGDSIAEQEMKSKYGVAVALFRMETNARAMAFDLREKKRKAFVATNGNDRWYSVIGPYADLSGAAEGMRKFRKENPSFIYVGMPGAPAIIRLI